MRTHPQREDPRQLKAFDAYFWLGSAAVMWLLTCICGALEMALGSTAYAWVGLMFASVAFSGIAALYVVKVFRA